MFRNKPNAIVLCLAFGGCALTDGDQSQGKVQMTDVANANELGVTQIETEHFDDNGASVFELRGLNAGQQQVALVRLRVGDIADMQQYLPGRDNRGSDIVFLAGGDQVRQVTRETSQYLVTVSHYPAIQSFLAVPEVSAALKREANMIVSSLKATAAPDGERPYDDVHWVASCDSANLLTTPVATQCCSSLEETWPEPGQFGVYYYVPTFFIRGSDNAVVTRWRNWVNWNSDTACKAEDGVSSCSGSDCYYGPNGFSRAYVNIYSGQYPREETFTNSAGSYCGVVLYSTPQTPIWGDVTGTFATGQGCPGGNGDNGNGQWDY